MQVLILRPFRKDTIYFRTIEEREKIKTDNLVGIFMFVGVILYRKKCHMPQGL